MKQMFNLDEEQTLKMLAMNTEHLNLWKLRMTTLFLLLNENIGGKSKLMEDGETSYLTEDQARHIYKKIELGNIININTVKWEVDQDQELNRLDDISGDINPCRVLIVNNTE